MNTIKTVGKNVAEAVAKGLDELGIKEENADIGVFFDGDADRALMVDENGRIVFPDFLLGVLAEEELKEHPNQEVYYDLRFSRAVRDAI